MTRRPLIGISGSHNPEESRIFIKENYMKAIQNAGGLPVLLPEFDDEEIIDQYLERLDGLLLAGGGDIDAKYFGEAMHPACPEPDHQRDSFEIAITRKALEKGMPIMGICRGVQILAVVMGGNLIQDIPDQRGIERKEHYQEAPYDKPHHHVQFTSGGLFEKVTGTDGMNVNSMHHQSIGDCGTQLQVEAVSADGIIEAVSAKDKPYVFGTQFHPEYLADESTEARRLFQHFLEQVKIYQQGQH